MHNVQVKNHNIIRFFCSFFILLQIEILVVNLNIFLKNCLAVFMKSQNVYEDEGTSQGSEIYFNNIWYVLY